jgi:hypothetical protein
LGVSPWDRGRKRASLLRASRWNRHDGRRRHDHRRLVGIDLGIASAHTVRVLDGEGNTIAKRKAWPTTESLTEVETAALAAGPATSVGAPGALHGVPRGVGLRR